MAYWQRLCLNGGNPVFALKMKKLFCLAWLGLLFRTASTSAITFDVTYDSSVTSLPNAAQVSGIRNSNAGCIKTCILIGRRSS